ncbi:MAG TPA: hypothetical protein VN282_19610 [Pyrinomonadaceae bacterium]|nr:hypothetical protein [Pyrinomonadaceae bacterium]
MREPQHQTRFDDEATLVVGGEETTLVAPRFDDEETLVARPVVPLGGNGGAPAPARSPARPAHEYRRPYAPRRSWTLALVLVSVLIGGVLGGAGLYLYQRQSQDPAVSPSAAAQQQPAADAAQAPVQQAAPHAESPAQQAATPAAPHAEESAPPTREEDVPATAPAREAENVPAAERRTEPSEGAPRRGKKGDRDGELERRPNSRPDGNAARADRPEARKVDTIFGRPRRAERRTRRDDDVDRLRRIFEGGP